jgi:hypothetical protein
MAGKDASKDGAIITMKLRQDQLWLVVCCHWPNHCLLSYFLDMKLFLISPKASILF